MKISIITVCYNSDATIRDTIRSVLSQDYLNIEYIIVDGNSKDLTMDIINGHRSEISKIICGEDQGIYDAMNKGIAASTGEIIGILNSDDVYSHDAVVSDLVKVVGSSEECSIFFGNVLFKNFKNNKILRVYSARRFLPFKLRFGWMPPHPATFVRKKIYTKFGFYSLDYQIAADYERFVKWLLVEKLDYKYFDAFVVDMRLGGESTSGVKSSIKLNQEIIKACKDNGIYTNWFFLIAKIPFKLCEFSPFRTNRS